MTLLLEATPSVAMFESENSLRVYRVMQHVFPTLLSPIVIVLIIWSAFAGLPALCGRVYESAILFRFNKLKIIFYNIILMIDNISK